VTTTEILARHRNDEIRTVAMPAGDAEYLGATAATLESRGVRVAFQRVSERHMIAILTEADGWETLGSAATQTPWRFDDLAGARYALEDAINKLGSGRFHESGCGEAEQSGQHGDLRQQTATRDPHLNQAGARIG